MLIFVEYIQNLRKGSICYEVDSELYGFINDKIPEWLHEDGIEYESYKITQILESIMKN